MSKVQIALCAAAGFALATAAPAPAGQAWMDSSKAPEDRAAALLAEMRVGEKLVMLHGVPNEQDGDVVYVGLVKGNERLGIPQLRLNDGPQGYRDDLYPRTSTAWPAGLALSATWDEDCFARWAEAMGDEFYRKGANIFLGPGLNLARVPLNGRNFEYISGEDPFLGYTLVQPFVKSMQGTGVMANAKHWVQNNQEANRDIVSENVDERTRHEMYYIPFAGAIEAGVGSFMCSYNKINGVWACENAETLSTDLKGHLGFKGFVMSDWWATHSVSINEGLDQEMPTGSWFAENLAAMVGNGTVSMEKVDDSVTRILVPMFEVGMFDTPNPNSNTNDVTTDAHSQLARELSAASHVLLQNKGDLLPLDAQNKGSPPLKLALIGRPARNPIVSGGGSGRVVPKHVVSPYEGIMARLGIEDAYPVAVDCPASGVRTNMTIAQGCWPSVPASSVEDCAKQCANDLACYFYSYKSHAEGYAWCTLYPTDYMLEATEDGTMVGNCNKLAPEPVWQCNKDNICVATVDGSDQQAAAKLAAEANVAIVLVASYAAEGADRESLSFDADMDGGCQFSAPAQDALVSVVAAANANVVVAATAPGAMLTPWRDEVKAILHGWLPGQEYGHALADVLFGAVNPAAKLSISLPNKENEVGFTPEEYPGISLQADYNEKLLIGYRWYQSFDVKPAFAFGHGLSYTTFAYSSIQCSANKVTVTVRNAGSRVGSEVAQMYLEFPADANTPPLQLRGFHKTEQLESGEETEIVFSLSDKDISVWDVSIHNWRIATGVYKVHVGAASDDIRLQGTFEV
jgi:beta-glucosidase